VHIIVSQTGRFVKGSGGRAGKEIFGADKRRAAANTFFENDVRKGAGA